MEATKTHWKKLTNPNYIGAYCLNEGQEITVTITKVVREMVDSPDGKKEECTVAHLKDQKPFVLNATNQKTITKIYGTPYIEDWVGKSITLYVAKIKAFGEQMEALRVKPIKPTVQMPELTPEHPRWNGAKTALKEGITKIEDIKKAFKISPENEVKLIAIEQ